MGWLVSYAKYDEIVASGVQTCSVVRNHIKNPSVFATNFVTFSTPPIDLACSILKLIVFILLLIDFDRFCYLFDTPPIDLACSILKLIVNN